MESSTIEGTWEEIQQYGSRLIGRRLRVTVLDEESNNVENRSKANRKMSEAIRKIKAEQKNMRFTDGSNTQNFLREARDGGMFGE